jgi:hypothetical protein
VSAKETSIGSDDFYHADKPTRLNNPKFKILINIVAFCVLGKNFNKLDGNFFTSLLLFCFPILLDWLSFTSEVFVRRIIKYIELAVVGIVFAVSLFGLMGIFIINNPSGRPHIMIAEGYFIFSGVSFSAFAVMMLLLGSLIITFVDCFCAPTKAEEKFFATTSIRRK